MSVPDHAEVLPADGQSVLRKTFPELFEAIGTSFGADDDEHFNLPNAPNGWISTGRMVRSLPVMDDYRVCDVCGRRIPKMVNGRLWPHSPMRTALDVAQGVPHGVTLCPGGGQ